MQAHPAQDRDHGRQPHQVVDDGLVEVGQEQAAGRGRQTNGQVDQPQPPGHPCRRHAILIGGFPLDLRAGSSGRPVRLRRSASVERAVVGALGGRVGLGALERPGEHERERVQVAVRQHRVAQVWLAVALQVGALQQVGGVPQAQCMAELVQRDPAQVLGVVRLVVALGWAWTATRASPVLR